MDAKSGEFGATRIELWGIIQRGAEFFASRPTVLVWKAAMQDSHR